MIFYNFKIKFFVDIFIYHLFGQLDSKVFTE